MVWMEQAEKMVEHCHQALLDKKSELAYLDKRGIPRAAVIKHRLGWHEGPKGADHRYSSYGKWGLEAPVNEKTGKAKPLWIPRGIVIPCIADGLVMRIRIRRPQEDVARFGNKYHIMPGSSMRTMMLNSSAKAFVIVEAELDAIAVDHAAGDLVCSIPVMTVEGKPDDVAAPLLEQSLCILNALDIGDTGGGAKAAERAREWWRRFPQCDLWPAPAGKDPGEAAERGEDLRLWVQAGLPPVFTMNGHGGGQSSIAGLFEGVADVSVDGGKAGGCVVSAVKRCEPMIFDASQDVFELAGLLGRAPVKVIKRAGELKVDFPRGWMAKHQDHARRISELVFCSPTVGRFLDAHPRRIINGGNLMSS
jgi:hypothetical protein